MEEFDVGQVIAGKYELVRLLGKGAMGAVWLAKHHTLDEKFAVKLLRTDVRDSNVDADEAAGRFQQEAQLSASLSRRTRHICSVMDHGEYDGWAYLVMEALDGESLEERLKRGALPAAEAADIVGQIARALTVAHSDLVFHRDSKPANIYLVKDEEGRLLVKLLDFGIARSIRPKATKSPFATTKDVVLGTPSYMSPEQARGLETLDHRCDLWALAVVAYECLTGTTPWEGSNVQEVFLSVCTHQWVPARTRNADLPYVVDAVFSRAFAFELDERFGSAKELAATLRAAFPTATSAQGGRTAFASRASFADDELAEAGLLAQDVSDPEALTPQGPVAAAVNGQGRSDVSAGPISGTMQSAQPSLITETGSELVPAGLAKKKSSFGRLFTGAALLAFFILTGVAIWWGVFESAASATPPAALTSPSAPPPAPPPAPTAAPADTSVAATPVVDEPPRTTKPSAPPVRTTSGTGRTKAAAASVATPPAAATPSTPPTPPTPPGPKPRGPRDQSDVF